MYAKAVENAVAKYQLDGTKLETFNLEVKEETQGREFTNTNLKVDYEGNVVCNTIEVYKNGKMYLADCEVNGKEVDYTYGTQQQVYKPQYYSLSSGRVSEAKPIDAKTTILELNTSNLVYLGLDVDNNDNVTSVYVCFNRNGTEYCLKGYDKSAYEINKNILKGAYEENVCYLGGECHCIVDGLNASAHAYTNGYVYVSIGSGSDVQSFCFVDDYGNFKCG